MPHVETKTLPETLRAALALIDFRRTTVELIAATEASTPGGAAFEGNRAHMIAVNLITGQTSHKIGAWGGSTPFGAQAAVDKWSEVPIPRGVAIISGEAGGRGAFARIYARPEDLTPMLPAAEPISDLEGKILYAIDGHKPGYRREYFEREGLGEYSVSNPIVADLIRRGFLKANKRGAISVTAKGKTARHNYQRF